jgi:hypothetical protein
MKIAELTRLSHLTEFHIAKSRSKQSYRLLQHIIHLIENAGAEKQYAVLPDFTVLNSRRFHAVPKHEVKYH